MKKKITQSKLRKILQTSIRGCVILIATGIPSHSVKDMTPSEADGAKTFIRNTQSLTMGYKLKTEEASRSVDKIKSRAILKMISDGLDITAAGAAASVGFLPQRVARWTGGFAATGIVVGKALRLHIEEEEGAASRLSKWVELEVDKYASENGIEDKGRLRRIFEVELAESLKPPVSPSTGPASSPGKP